MEFSNSKQYHEKYWCDRDEGDQDDQEIQGLEAGEAEVRLHGQDDGYGINHIKAGIHPGEGEEAAGISGVRDLVVFLQTYAAVDIAGLGSEGAQESAQQDHLKPGPQRDGVAAALLQYDVESVAVDQMGQDDEEGHGDEHQRGKPEDEF